MDLVAAITEAAQRYGVDPDLALAVARKESALDPLARGAAGEVGLFQLSPATAADLGINPFDVSQNIQGGIRYLRQQLERFGDVRLALMAYNAGPSRVASGAAPAASVRYAAEVLALEDAGSAAWAPEAGVVSTGAAWQIEFPRPALSSSLLLVGLLLAASLWLAFAP